MALSTQQLFFLPVAFLSCSCQPAPVLVLNNQHQQPNLQRALIGMAEDDKSECNRADVSSRTQPEQWICVRGNQMPLSCFYDIFFDSCLAFKMLCRQDISLQMCVQRAMLYADSIPVDKLVNGVDLD